MAKKYRSEAFSAVHETMAALHDIGAIDQQTMGEFDDACCLERLRSAVQVGIADIDAGRCKTFDTPELLRTHLKSVIAK
jgi:DNA-binding transcriptional regulator YiaG